MKISDFRPQEKNANKHTPYGLRLMEQSIQRDGIIDAQTAAADGEIISGSARLELEADKFADVEPIIVHSDGTRPVIVVRDDIPNAENARARRLSVAANQVARADYDPDWALLKEWNGEDDQIAKMFNDDEWREGTGEEKAQADAEPQIDRAAELQEKWQVKTGDLWQIGEHRLLCGDSTKREDVEWVMGGEKAVLMATDPPYGDSWVAKANDMQEHGYGHSHAGLHGSIENDDLSEEELYSFLCSFLECAKLAGDAPMPSYVWHGAKRMIFERALIESGWFVHQSVLWVKRSFVIGRMHYHPRCEWALHGWRLGNGKCPFYGERNQSDVWEIDRENQKIHPTQKPIELFSIPIRNHTLVGEICYEPFAGSGSQFVAGQNDNRRVYGIEKEEKYCAVTLERMSTAFPGIEIKRLE